MTPALSLPAVSHPPAKTMLWVGRILSGLAAAFLAMDATMKVFNLIPAQKGTADLGWDPKMLFTLGVLQVVLLVLYLVPRTAVFGAILWVGYLGGAVATHARISDPLFSHTLFPVYVGAFLWLGLWLRNERVRAVVPFNN